MRREARYTVNHSAIGLLAAALVLGSASLAVALEPSAPDSPATGPQAVDLETLTIEVEGPEGEVTVGDPIVVTLRVRLPPGLELRSIETIDAGRLELRHDAIELETTPGAEVLATGRLELVTYRPGRHRIEGFALRFRQPDGRDQVRRVAGLEVLVESLLALEQSPELRGEKDGVPVRYRSYTLAWVLGVGGALAAMGLLGFFIARSRPRVVIEPPPPPPRPAHEIALEKLRAIEEDGLVEGDEVMAFSVRLSALLREYLGNRFGFDGLDMTTSEILERLRAVDLPQAYDRRRIGLLLHACDLVKFARGSAPQEERREALEAAYGLVQATMLPIRPAAPEATEPPAPEPAEPLAGEAAEPPAGEAGGAA